MAESAIDLLERVVVASVAITARAIATAEADLTFVQWRVLVIVGEGGDGATVSEIATRLGANPSPASRLISRLRRRGLASATKDDPDRRVTRVRLTPLGRTLRGRVLAARRRDLRDVSGVGPADREAIRRLASALESRG